MPFSDMSASPYSNPRVHPRRVLIISDEHRGSKHSNFAAYQGSLVTKMANYDDIVELGDNIELFRIKNDHVQDAAQLLDRLAGRGEAHWHRKIAGVGSDYAKVKSAIKGERLFMEVFLEKYPHKRFHKVLGNHEMVKKFCTHLDALQQAYPNFEWSPEAIRIGDGLFTHGHLPEKGIVDSQAHYYRMREAQKKDKWRGVVAAMEGPWHLVNQYRFQKDRAAAMVHSQLMVWDQIKGFHYVHERSAPIDFSMDWVKHVFFGHTHVKFDNLSLLTDSPSLPSGEVFYHNSGAMVHRTSGRSDDLGILEAELYPDGSLRNIQPVYLRKDSKSVAFRY